jgi:hypothetical protein
MSFFPQKSKCTLWGRAYLDAADVLLRFFANLHEFETLGATTALKYERFLRSNDTARSSAHGREALLSAIGDPLVSG